MSGKVRKSNPYVKRGMCQSAWGATHAKNTYLPAFYRRMQIRKGPQQPIKADSPQDDAVDLTSIALPAKGLPVAEVS
jgi:hypothetical protein